LSIKAVFTYLDFWDLAFDLAERHSSHQTHGHGPQLTLEWIEDEFQRFQRRRSKKITIPFFAEDGAGPPMPLYSKYASPIRRSRVVPSAR